MDYSQRLTFFVKDVMAMLLYFLIFWQKFAGAAETAVSLWNFLAPQFPHIVDIVPMSALVITCPGLLFSAR